MSCSRNIFPGDVWTLSPTSLHRARFIFGPGLVDPLSLKPPKGYTPGAMEPRHEVHVQGKWEQRL